MKYISGYFGHTFSHQNINTGGYKIKILLESESFTCTSWLENMSFR